MTPEDLKQKQDTALAAKLDHDAKLYKTRLAALEQPSSKGSWLLGLIQHYAVIVAFVGAIITAGQFFRGWLEYRAAQKSAASAENLRIAEYTAAAFEKGEVGSRVAATYLALRRADTKLDSSQTRFFTELQEVAADVRNHQRSFIQSNEVHAIRSAALAMSNSLASILSTIATNPCLQVAHDIQIAGVRASNDQALLSVEITKLSAPQAQMLSAVGEDREVPREQRPQAKPPPDPSWQPILTNTWVKPNDMRGFRYYLQIGRTNLYFWPTLVGVNEVDFVLTENPAGRDQGVITAGTLRVGADFRFSYPAGTSSTNMLLKLDGIRIAGRWPTRAAFISAYVQK